MKFSELCFAFILMGISFGLEAFSETCRECFIRQAEECKRNPPPGPRPRCTLSCQDACSDSKKNVSLDLMGLLFDDSESNSGQFLINASEKKSCGVRECTVLNPDGTFECLKPGEGMCSMR